MYYSAVSTLDRKDSVSSDEDGDIYRQTGRDVSNCPPNRTDKTGDGQMSLDELNRGLHKPDQVGRADDLKIPKLTVCNRLCSINRIKFKGSKEVIQEDTV